LIFPFQVRNRFEPLSDPDHDFIAGIAGIVAPAGLPIRRRRLADEFGSVFDEFGVEGLVEGGEDRASRVHGDFGRRWRSREQHGGQGGRCGKYGFHDNS
jgi:hypothetical protein